MQTSTEPSRAERETTTRDPGALGYRPALDGVRALAVVAVLVYHGLPDAAPGGFLGVDVFFVLSGYLITSLLVNEATRTRTIELGRFWARRARRLLPALVLACAAIVGIGLAFPKLVDVPAAGADIAATLGYVVNWRFVIAHQDYFAQFAQPSMLRHTWSLAIEEQFYLIWPLVAAFALVWRCVRPSRFAIGCAIAAIASAVWMAVLFEAGASTTRLYYGTDTRAQALLLGAAFGAAGVGHRFLRSARTRRFVSTVGLAGFVGIVICFLAVDDRTTLLYTGGFALAAVCAMALITDAAQPDPSPLGRVLGILPLVWIGRISYGIYLWHWPIVLILTPARVGVSGVALFGIRVAVTLVVALASYVLVEKPIRSGALHGWRFWTLVPAAAVLVVGGGFVVTATATRVFVPPTASRQLRPAPTPTPTSAAGGNADDGTGDAGADARPRRRRFGGTDPRHRAGLQVPDRQPDGVERRHPRVRPVAGRADLGRGVVVERRRELRAVAGPVGVRRVGDEAAGRDRAHGNLGRVRPASRRSLRPVRLARGRPADGAGHP